MPQFSAGQVKIGSGILGSEIMTPILRVTNFKWDFSVPRANVSVLNRGKPLEQRVVVNYTPVNVSMGLIQSDLRLEQILGLVNPTGIALSIADANPSTSRYGIRNMQVLYAPTSSSSYNGEIDFLSGVLTNYSLQGSIDQPIVAQIGMNFLDLTGSNNFTSRDTTNYAAGVIKPENMNLTGIQFNGYGITGFTIQSFGLNVSFTRTAVQQLGNKYPIDRPLVDVQAQLQIQGFIEGVNNTLTGLSQYDCGNPTYGNVYLTLYPSCSTSSPYTITMKNPYLDSQAVDAQVGGFTTAAFQFSLPLGPNALENTDGSVLYIT